MADEQPAKDQQPDEESEEQKESRRRSGILAFILFLAGVVILVVLVGWGVGWDQLLASRTNPETEDAYADGTERPLGARVTGYVTQVLVTDNQPVRAGQVLIVIEDDTYRATLAQANARLAASEATLDALRAQVVAATATVARTDSDTGATQAQANFAGQEAARQNRIEHSDLGLPRRTQQTDAADRVAQAQVARSRSQGRSARAQRDALLASFAEAQGARDLAAAQSELARLDLVYTRVVAPQDGVLGIRRVHVGDLVSAGQEIVPLTPLNDVWVTGYFNERQMDQMRIGDRASLKFDAFPDVRLVGHVRSIGPLTAQQFSAVPPDNVTGNYTKVIQRVPVKIVIDPATNSLAGMIRPGLSVLARVDTTDAVDVGTVR